VGHGKKKVKKNDDDKNVNVDGIFLHTRTDGSIDVEASKFLLVQRTFAQIFSNLPKKLSSHSCGPFFGVTSRKWSANVERHFSPEFHGLSVDI